MFSGMYAAASGISAAERNQEIVAHNLSHVNTTGFRGQVPSFEALLNNQVNQYGNSGSYGTIIRDVEYDFQHGPMQETGRTLDVALQGDGFFVVETDQGERYTRNGVMFVGSEGDLVTAGGYPIAGESGPIRIPPEITPDRIQIATDGTVSVDDAVLGKIRVVNFQNLSQLVADGATLFTANGATAEPIESMVRQGVREGSNVQATQELIRLIAGVRHHEASQRALRSMSDALQQHTRP